jgi:hypothetical protein
MDNFALIFSTPKNYFLKANRVSTSQYSQLNEETLFSRFSQRFSNNIQSLKPNSKNNKKRKAVLKTLILKEMHLQKKINNKTSSVNFKK